MRIRGPHHAQYSELSMVPGEGVEPSLPKEPDFESGASTNSAIQAYSNANPSQWIAFRNKGIFMGIFSPQVHKKEIGV